jgi:hypothetical protein
MGGEHGLHSTNFCPRYPSLSATVFDWPQARQAAEAVIAAERMNDRLRFQEGDFWTDDLDSDYDIALLFNIIHMYQPEKNIELVHKVAGASNPGALVVITDHMAVKSSGAMAEATAGLIGMLLFNDVNGQTYAPSTVREWLEGAGFTNTRAVMLRNSLGFALVIGTKTG